MNVLKRVHQQMRSWFHERAVQQQMKEQIMMELTASAIAHQLEQVRERQFTEGEQ